MNATRKTVLVTGSSSGIGLEVARTMLDAGWSVVINGRHAERLSSVAARLGHPDALASVPGSTADRATGEAMVAVAQCERPALSDNAAAQTLPQTLP